MASSRLRPARLAVLTALTLAGLAGCGSAANDAPQAAAGHPSATLAAEVVGRFLPATGAQNAAGQKFFQTQAARQNSLADRCVSQRGFSAREQPYVRWDEHYLDQPSPWVPGWEGADHSSVVLFNIPLLARGGLLDEIMTGSPAPPRLPTAEETAIDNAYALCQNTAAHAFQDLGSAGGELDSLWAQEVSAIRSSRPVRSAVHGFTSCAQAHGAPAAAAQSLNAFAIWLANLVQPTVNLAAIKTPITSRIAEDRHWTQVFATCAKAPVSLEDQLQLRQQHAFVRAHHRQLLALEDLASRVMPAAG